jgi:hypothetical protein
MTEKLQNMTTKKVPIIWHLGPSFFLYFMQQVPIAIDYNSQQLQGMGLFQTLYKESPYSVELHKVKPRPTPYSPAVLKVEIG